MASNNIGKTFEQEFKECVPPDYYLYRLKDDTSGFYGVSNPCDYILFRSPYLFMVELKTQGGEIDTSEMDEQAIKEANTGSHVFPLRVLLSILDAIEDVDIFINKD